MRNVEPLRRLESRAIDFVSTLGLISSAVVAFLVPAAVAVVRGTDLLAAATLAVIGLALMAGALVLVREQLRPRP